MKGFAISITCYKFLQLAFTYSLREWLFNIFLIYCIQPNYRTVRLGFSKLLEHLQ